jgi:pSer/pThr/pTyr-binding forkhead associated (FHA) protein
MLDELAAGRSLRQLGPWQFEFVESAGCDAGTVRASAAYREPAHRPEGIAPGATRVITRQRGRQIVLDDGTRVPLTHTPFVIGRGAGCDLVIPDLSISRRHAEIGSGPGGAITIRDLDSRNGVLLDGQRIESESELRAGAMFTLGDARFWLEAGE